MNYKLFNLEIHAWSSISSNNIKYEYQPTNQTPLSVPQIKKKIQVIFFTSPNWQGRNFQDQILKISSAMQHFQLQAVLSAAMLC